MANTYTWDCRTVDTYPTHTDPNEVTESDVVYNVHWRLTATTEDEAQSTTSIGTQALSVEDLSGFTAFATVTHADVIGWVEAGIGAEQVTSLKAGLDSQLAELAAPTSVTRTIVDAE
tara:strand:+ start:182 stop:532 length:351 start_codon:yes stop_codon:yes gene_type:complete